MEVGFASDLISCTGCATDMNALFKDGIQFNVRADQWLKQGQSFYTDARTSSAATKDFLLSRSGS